MNPRVVVGVLLVLLLSSPALADDPAAAFGKFCEEWMEKLAARERRNSSIIKWEDKSGSVLGSYVGYSKQHTCELKENKEAKNPVPVGKITYLEVRYEKTGVTKDEAERSQARPVETTEVTEIFRYAKGVWVY